MIRRVFALLYKETDKLHQAAFLLAAFSLSSQVLAFLRDRLLAHFFGAGSDLDVYYAAFRIPDFLFVTVASIVSLSVLVPFIVEKEKNGQAEVRKFIGDIFSFFAFFIVVISILAFFLIPVLSSVLFKGFSGPSLARVIFLSRLFLLSPIFLGISNLLGSLTQAYNRFLSYAFAPVLYNLGIIVGVLALSPFWGVTGVAIGVVLGSFLHMALQIPFVWRLGLLPKWKLFFDWNSIKKVIGLSFPRTLTLSTNHLATIFLISLASLMPAGTITVYSFALNISSVPLSIIGVSYSLAAFPTLTRHFSDKNIKAFVEHMSATIRHILFWSMPLISLFVVLRAQIVRVLLGSGRFNWNDTKLTAAALAIFSISVAAQSLLLLFVRSFYSAGHTRKPLVINIISTTFLMLITYGFVKLFYTWPDFRYFMAALLKINDVPGNVVMMLPLGYSIGTIINAVVHWIGFERDFGTFPREVYRTLWVTMAGAVFTGLGAYLGLNIFASVFSPNQLWSVFMQGFLAGVIGIVFGGAILWLLKSHELSETIHALKSRFGGVKPIADNPEIV